jgi:hypothetical protein
MRRRMLVAALVLSIALGMGVRPAQADFVTAAIVARILDALYRAERTINNIEGVMSDIRGKFQNAYPLRALQHIERLFVQARGMADEIGALSCSPLGLVPRMDRVFQGVFGGLHLCRPELETLLGGPPIGPSAELDQLHDASSTLRLNHVASMASKDAQRAEFAGWLSHEAIQAGDPYDPENPYSVGYSQRLTAVGTAALATMAVEDGDTRALDLQLRNEMWMEERRAERLDRALSNFFFLSAAGEAPGASSVAAAGFPPVLEEALR